MTKQHCLMGKKLTSIYLAKDNLALKFKMGKEEIIARTDGDCCSTSWIEHITLPAGGFPCTVLEVKELDLIEQIDDDPEYDCLKIYGLELVTDKGSFIVDYRNSSNGYYGGNLSWPGDCFYGGVYDQNVSKNDFKRVTKDI